MHIYVLACACLCVYVRGYLCVYEYTCPFSGSGNLILTGERLASDYIQGTHDEYMVQGRRGCDGRILNEANRA